MLHQHVSTVARKEDLLGGSVIFTLTSQLLEERCEIKLDSRTQGLTSEQPSPHGIC